MEDLSTHFKRSFGSCGGQFVLPLTGPLGGILTTSAVRPPLMTPNPILHSSVCRKPGNLPSVRVLNLIWLNREDLQHLDHWERAAVLGQGYFVIYADRTGGF